MNIYQALISEVVIKLRGTNEQPENLALLGVEVSRLKQFKAEYSELQVNQKGRVYVGFPMQRFGTESQPTNFLIGSPAQMTDIYLTASVSARSLYDEEINGQMYYGLYTYVEMTQRLLMGFKPSIGGELSAFGVDITLFDKNTWHYQVMFRVRDVPMEPIENSRNMEELDANLLKRLSWVEDLDEPEIVTNLDEEILIGDKTLTI